MAALKEHLSVTKRCIWFQSCFFIAILLAHNQPSSQPAPAPLSAPHQQAAGIRQQASGIRHRASFASCGLAHSKRQALNWQIDGWSSLHVHGYMMYYYCGGGKSCDGFGAKTTWKVADSAMRNGHLSVLLALEFKLRLWVGCQFVSRYLFLFVGLLLENQLFTFYIVIYFCFRTKFWIKFANIPGQSV